VADLPGGPAGHLLPQTGIARLITNIVRSGPGFVEATGRVPAVHPLVAGDRAPCFLGLELGAQAAAALAALERGAATGDHSPNTGYLVRVREATFLRPDLPVDAPLAVTAHLTGAAHALSIYRIRVSVGGVESLRATLGTYRRTDSAPR
jgi:predicted hotdog family 3-hydroxylacyl-ACP dehydratase